MDTLAAKGFAQLLCQGKIPVASAADNDGLFFFPWPFRTIKTALKAVRFDSKVFCYRPILIYICTSLYQPVIERKLSPDVDTLNRPDYILA